MRDIDYFRVNTTLRRCSTKTFLVHDFSGFSAELFASFCRQCSRDSLPQYFLSPMNVNYKSKLFDDLKWTVTRFDLVLSPIYHGL